MLVLGDFGVKKDGAKIVTDWVLSNLEFAKISYEQINLLPIYQRSFILKRIFLGLKAIKSLISYNGPRIIYMPLAGGRQAYMQLIIVFIARVLKYRIYLHHHSYSYIIVSKRIMNLLFRISKSNSVHIFLTKKMKEDFQQATSRIFNCIVLGNAGVVADYVNCEPHTVDSEKIVKNISKIGIVHYGRLSTEKGIYEVLRLYKLILQNFPGVTCHLLGPTDESKAKIEISHLIENHSSFFHYLDSYTQESLPKLVTACNYFVFPSQYKNEAAPLVVYEAQSLGLICLTSRAGSLDTIVKSPGVAIPFECWVQATFEMIQEIVNIDLAKREIYLKGAKLRILGEYAENVQVSQENMKALIREMSKLISQLNQKSGN